MAMVECQVRIADPAVLWATLVGGLAELAASDDSSHRGDAGRRDFGAGSLAPQAEKGHDSTMISPVQRVFQRYLIPRFVASIYFYMRYRCMVSRQARVQVSGNVTFGAGTVVKPFVIIQTHQGRISMGENCAISSFDHISTGDGDIILGDTVRIAPNVTIVGGTKAFKKRDVSILDQGVDERQGVTIGSDVLIGAGTVILPGCTIGDGAVIGAGSVVNGDVEPYSVVAGAPARAVGHRE